MPPCYIVSKEISLSFQYTKTRVVRFSVIGHSAPGFVAEYLGLTSGFFQNSKCFFLQPTLLRDNSCKASRGEGVIETLILSLISLTEQQISSALVWFTASIAANCFWFKSNSSVNSASTVNLKAKENQHEHFKLTFLPTIFL